MKHPQQSLASDGTHPTSDRLPPSVTCVLPLSLAYLVTEFPLRQKSQAVHPGKTGQKHSMTGEQAAYHKGHLHARKEL